LQKIAEVLVVAPATEQSAVGHSITLLTPLLIQTVFDDRDQMLGWAVEGRPADCVKLALTELVQQPVDLVVSGINSGSNAGINVIYSGTVAAAIEGAFFDITSVAISLEYVKPVHLNFPRAAELARGVIEQILAHKPAPGTLFNVNIPSLERGEPQGVKVVPQGLRRYRERYDRRTDPRGRVYFWITPELQTPEHEADTDVTAMAERYITVTPLKFDLTSQAKLQKMRAWEWQL
jgi:5'-nucleotidase